MSRVAYEVFTLFLISLLIFFLVKAFNQAISIKTKKYVYFAGLTLGYLALTKVIFCYVLIFMFCGSILLWLINRSIVNYRKAIFIILIALITTLPYLIYTYNLTGKIFYLATGSDNLYWMSTPYKGEYGDWKENLTINPVENGNYNIPGADDTLIAHHQKDYEEVYKLNAVERDEAFKRIAIRNIRSHPLKYAQNVFFNIGRMVFHYPFSQAIQRPKPLFVMPLNGIILTLTLLCLIPTFINWRKILFPIRFMLFFVLLYLGASSLVSAETRMFTTIVPILLFWIAFIVQKSLKVNLKFDKNGKQ